RDPYRVTFLSEKKRSRSAPATNCALWLWVPAFAETTERVYKQSGFAADRIEDRKSIQFARTTTGARCDTSASPSSLCCSRGIEKQTEKPSVVRSVTMPWAGSVDCSIAHDASG